MAILSLQATRGTSLLSQRLLSGHLRCYGTLKYHFLLLTQKFSEVIDKLCVHGSKFLVDSSVEIGHTF